MLGTSPLLGQALLGTGPSKFLGQARSWDMPFKMLGFVRLLHNGLAIFLLAPTILSLS